MPIPFYPLQEKEANWLEETGLALQYFKNLNIPDEVLHQHNYVEIMVVLKGQCRHIMGKQVYIEQPGAMGIIHYRQGHAIRTDQGPVDVMNIYLDLTRRGLPTMPPAFRDILPSILPFHPVFKNKRNQMIHLQFENPQRITPLLWGMHDELQQGQTGRQEALESYFRLFLMECCRSAQHAGHQPTPPASSGAEQIEQLRSYLDTHCTESLGLDDLSRKAGLSRTSLCRSFKKHIGQTLFEYLLHRRIERSMALLRSENDKILSIALQCGFNDLSYFNRKFKKLVGVTPREYRQSNPISSLENFRS